MSQPPPKDKEREAFIKLNPDKFYIRHPPPPEELDSFTTRDDQLFQTIHMGAAEIDPNKWMLVITGMVERPFALTLEQLKRWPKKSITAFHECYGSPLVPPTKALRRVGNVSWTGVPLHALLAEANVKPGAKFIWSEGLDRGKFAGVEADRYQKDLPMDKALNPEVLVAFEMNGQPLEKNRGWPARLIVPGWFGTNSTKWLSKLEVQDRRAEGPFTTKFYNERYPSDDPTCESRPIWKVQPNSCIVRPAPGSQVQGPRVFVEGWAWSEDGVIEVGVSADEGATWTKGEVEGRSEFSWQSFRGTLELSSGRHTVLARARGWDGRMQPMGEGRNRVHRVDVEVS